MLQSQMKRLLIWTRFKSRRMHVGVSCMLIRAELLPPLSCRRWCVTVSTPTCSPRRWCPSSLRRSRAVQLFVGSARRCRSLHTKGSFLCLCQWNFTVYTATFSGPQNRWPTSCGDVSVKWSAGCCLDVAGNWVVVIGSLRGHDASQITLALGTAAAYPRACQALGAMLSKGALNPADITVLFKMFSSMDPPPVELVRVTFRLRIPIPALLTESLTGIFNFFLSSDQSACLSGPVHAVPIQAWI